jgi:MscS family membrane protein
MHTANVLSVTVRVSIAYSLSFALAVGTAHAQQGAAAPPPTAQSQPEPWKDPLGRGTPRGTVMGFLNAARANENAVAAQYLNAPDARAERLARQLFVVLDARLSGRLARISDEPEGSTSEGVLTPNQETVGTVESSKGDVEIVLERVARGDPLPIWLFSSKTLEQVPALYEEVANSGQQPLVPAFLVTTRLGGIRLVDYLAVFLGLLLVYLLTIVINRALTPVIQRAWRRVVPGSDAIARNVLPAPAKLLLVTIAGGQIINALPVSLALRQLWWGLAGLVIIIAIAWLLLLVTGEVERHLRRRLPHLNIAAAASLLRLLRRSADVLVLVGALIAILRNLGIDPTPALAGLGVGGIAVALAAQKTLENVIAGASLIFDQAVRGGDVLRMGDVVGTVDRVGLRSTRIRTLDRTLVSVPNSQIANASLETLSERDKFWFHPMIGLRYETTPKQLHDVVDGLTQLLHEHPLIEPDSVRVRFIRLGSYSLDIEVFAYLAARDWNHFLEIQEQLLFSITEIVDRAGTSFAFPSQTMYLANTSAGMTDREALSAR